MPRLDKLRHAIRAREYADEAQVVGDLLGAAGGILTGVERDACVQRARRLVERCREKGNHPGTLDVFLQEFGLSNREGVALMCLAEALLRIPDEATADRLIKEKIRHGDWNALTGQSASVFVNAAVWALMLTGRLVALDEQALSDPRAWLRRLVARSGEPVVRKAMLQAMRILGRQFVLGRDIDEALRRSRSQRGRGIRFSFDMLGEGARTFADAGRYRQAYSRAIDAIGTVGVDPDPVRANGISVKISALHPRFEHAQRRRLETELAPALKALARQAKRHGLGFSIDAEEAPRLEPTMDLFEQLARDPELADWNGLGFVLQAYQKRAPEVVDWLIRLARETNRRLPVRLVKGAYWDWEIKRAQELGLPDYPVFSRKAHTDLCYEHCAARLLAAGPETVFPQFATHNAVTACSVLALAAPQERAGSAGMQAIGGASGLGRRRPQGQKPVAPVERFEFQRLHGMGHALYSELLATQSVPLRIYAPVGSHRDLLPYLVRRLLENGANSSFVNRFMDAGTPVDLLVRDCLSIVRQRDVYRHPRIPPPPEIYRAAGEDRQNSAGIDLDSPAELDSLMTAVHSAERRSRSAGPIIGGSGRRRPVVQTLNPARRHRAVGRVSAATAQDVDEALALAQAAQRAWDAHGANGRAAVLEQAADLLEARCAEFVALIVTEAGRTLSDALAEVREAVDFCRYYALQARHRFGGPTRLPGPTGEVNEMHLCGRGVFACISPWNFPLAIFMGQVAAALAAGNAVVAKPAEQTPLVAAQAVRLLHEAGVPADGLHLLPGDGVRIGGGIVRDRRVAGVAFTGSFETAKLIEQELGERGGPIAPLIAETGGQNAMLVDSTALPEQVVDDVIASVFQSAGQRCSALRVLYLQEEIAESVLIMLAGAMRALVVGDPLDPATDIGPVIDTRARDLLEQHVATMQRTGRLVERYVLPPACEQGSFVAPCIFEIDSIRRLDREVFGPLLHVVRFAARDLDSVLDEIEDTGYGLTLGIQSRIEGYVLEILGKTRAGNVYVNRNMTGAVVGVHPFGGRGLSGTGPKAGGPHYLLRFATERTLSRNVAALGGNVELFGLGEH